MLNPEHNHEDIETAMICLGPKGSYGHEAAKIAVQKLQLEYDTPILFESTNVSVLQAAERGSGLGIIPVENSTYGDVVDVLGYLAKQSTSYPLRIIGEVELPIRHCLLSKQTIYHSTKLKGILSHPQALGQCSKSLKRWGFTQIESTTSTASAAKFVAEHPEMDLGAIASKLAAKEYNLKVIEYDVQDLEDNMTRFFVFGPKQESVPTGNDKTVIIFRIPNEPGMLLETFVPFASRQINMTAIHSVSLGGWNYGFYIELEGHEKEARTLGALLEMKECTKEFTILGSFPK